MLPQCFSLQVAPLPLKNNDSRGQVVQVSLFYPTEPFFPPSSNLVEKQEEQLQYCTSMAGSNTLNPNLKKGLQCLLGWAAHEAGLSRQGKRGTTRRASATGSDQPEVVRASNGGVFMFRIGTAIADKKATRRKR